MTLLIRQVTRGSCDKSFGIHVARIANFPAHVVAEAESLAIALENGELLSAHFLGGGGGQSVSGTNHLGDRRRPENSRKETEEALTGHKRKTEDALGNEAAFSGAQQKSVLADK